MSQDSNLNFQLTNEELIQIANDVSNVSYSELNTNYLQSKQTIYKLIKQDYAIINTILNTKGQGLQPEVENALALRVFQDVIALRVFFTKQEYILQVGLNNGDTLETPLSSLFDKSAGYLITTNQQIQYHINKIRENIKQIERYNQMLKHLNDLLFTNPPIKEEDPSFIYQHSSKNKDTNYGQFWNGNYFAAYGLVDPVYHYFIPQGKGESNLYTSETALFYNRGHVYEWFLADINKNPNMQRTPQPVPFMKRHSKDNVAFLKAGDYTRKAKSKDGSYTIQAVQVKKQNNTKLISYYQLKSTLETLLGLTGTVSKEKYKQIVKEAFVAKQRNLSRGASTKVDQVVDNLFQKLQDVQMK